MDPERARYLKAIEQRFLLLRGRGMMLSPRDVMIVDSWRKRGVPARVVLAALEDGVQRFVETHSTGTPLPSSLAYFVGHVERAVRDRQELLVDGGGRAETAGPSGDDDGTGDGDGVHVAEGAREAVMEAIAGAGRRQQSESAREALRFAWRRLVRPGANDALWSLVTTVDRDMVRMLAATLTDDEAKVLKQAVDDAVERAGGQAMSGQARHDVAQAEEERWVREHFGAPDLLEVLIERGM